MDNTTDMMNRIFRSVAGHDPQGVSGFMTSAMPTKLTDSQLRETGFRSYSEVQFHVTCPDYPDCSVFLKSYSETWWETLGQSVDNIESCDFKSYNGSKNELLVTYKLKEPIFYARLSELPQFIIFSPPSNYCIAHDLLAGQPQYARDDEFVYDPSVNCCSTVRFIKFNFTILGIEV